MNLCPVQIELLKEVRAAFDEIDCARRTGYICLELNRIARAGRGREELSHEAKRLFDAIQYAISPNMTIEMWIARRYTNWYRFSISERHYLTHMARCAWLDRMIETGVCA
ncbi:hypothetical protein BcepF1.014 [Burkholderia phage BcepF1]|uniref:Uncharacterized protein n=1 Tax=Burkholderia phage BcepF1 TaxID=2886897 RepID=A1YZR8_9CAUD|nr:hypothetical protein BcepF1.014 [Burkholderia phage BcepF1]ABL96745.1 hypothetical protein BcepF1.014 [Burkholderia phage BcepF1]